MLYLIFTRQITIGQFFSLFIYSFFIFGPLQEMGNVINTYRETEASLDVFQAILEIAGRGEAGESPCRWTTCASLAFDDVSFTHQTASSPALTGVSFAVERGETLAFVGPSGLGEDDAGQAARRPLPAAATGRCSTTARRRRPSTSTSCAAQIGFVTQDTQLFSGSIRENLLFVNPTATDAECLEVLRRAACDSLLARADQGLDTVIGEGGMKISGGEKQRLSIARALLRRPHLLVFDEATSSLDSLTEEEITRTIREVASSQVITILIAHRLSTVLHADTIHVLERGRIVESGRHEDLLERKGLYYAMWRQQVGERRPVAPVPPAPAMARLAATAGG